ncbi:hypothetical protein [Myceligenerans xiligouense]|uniref:Mce-associated membrane protein n=1 Tax=Myceligenerans xiligouense TaxID=253184 RepID=A0A3N4YLA9_9MICO|nr:hypothetical protein [Myceligenerans xiligouense]RPF21473.1 hypothetical protein EDD34_2102 [Myceligenerans xiligouense]
MGIERRLVTVATVVLLAAAGCTSNANPAPTPTPATSSPALPPSPTKDSERAAADVEAIVREYYQVSDSVAKAPADVAPLDAVAADPALSRSKAEFEQWAAEGWYQTGDLTVAELVVQSVSLGSSDDEATAQVDVCYDVTGLDIVDADGTSQVAANRPDRRWERLTVTSIDNATDAETAWRVSDQKTLEQEPCAAS